MTKAPVPKQSGNLVAVDIMEDFARFPIQRPFSTGTRIALYSGLKLPYFALKVKSLPTS
jgi:hypothetical protein